MGKYKTKYNNDWEKKYDWVQKMKDDPHSARCKLCDATIAIGNSGLAQLRQHTQKKKHQDAEAILSGKTPQSTLVTSPGGRCKLSKGNRLIKH